MSSAVGFIPGCHPNQLVQRNKQDYWKTLLNSVHLVVVTNDLSTYTIVRTTLFSIINILTEKSCSVAFM